MHESTRRNICRVTFLALCVAPTIAVLAWAAHVRSPHRVERAERELSATFELSASIDAIADPRPGVVVYSGVVLSDAQTRRVVAEIATLEATELAEGVALVAPRAEVDATQLDLLWRAVDRLLRIGRTTDHPAVRLSIDRVTLHGATGDAITLGNVAGQLTCGEEASRAGLRFALPGANVGEPALLVVQRSRGGGAGAARMELRTGSAPLPLAVARTAFPSLAHLGERATFTGQLWASATGRGGESWTGEVTGRLAEVDLDALVTRQFGHKLSGEAEITLQKLAFAEGRVSRVVGRCDAGPGVVGRSLLDAAAESLAMRTATSAARDARDLIEYEQLAFAFDIDGRNARLEGMAGLEGTNSTARQSNAGPDASLAVARDAFGPLLLQAERQPQPALGIVRMLVPASDVQVPASRESEWLLRRLPIADAASSSASPRATLRDAAAQKSSPK